MRNQWKLNQNNWRTKFYIKDLLVLNASLAVGFALQRFVVGLELSSLMQSGVKWFDFATTTMFSVTCGLPIASVYLFSCLCLRPKTLRTFEPGHWLLLSMFPGTASLFITVSRLLVLGDGAKSIDLVVGCLSSASAFVILLLAGKLQNGLWRVLLWLFAINYVFDIFASMFFACFKNEYFVSLNTLLDMSAKIIISLGNFYSIMLGVALACLCFLELRSNLKRDFWHWIGILTAFLVVVILPIFAFAFSLVASWA